MKYTLRECAVLLHYLYTAHLFINSDENSYCVST
jgi:hypothetical protein